MITRVEIKNYRSIAHADVQMGPLTVLVGRNGAGKSSFVDALKFVRDALQFGLENAVNSRGGFSSIRRYGAPESENVEIAISVESLEFTGRYELSLSSREERIYINKEKAIHRTYGFFEDDPPQGEIVNEIEFERSGQDWTSKPSQKIYLFADISIAEDAHLLNSSSLALPAIMLINEFVELRRAIDGDFHNLFPNTLREPQKRVEIRVFSDDADNFLSILRNLVQNEEAKREIVNALSHAVEGVNDIRVRGLGSYLIGELRHRDLKDAPWFDFARESDGTLRMLGLLTALYQTPSFTERGVLALEEPEDALHPGALAILADEIKAASHRRQVLITTQSPDLIARFPAADLRVVERREGVTHIAPLDETQRRVIEDQLFDAGELLRSEGLRGTTR